MPRLKLSPTRVAVGIGVLLLAVLGPCAIYLHGQQEARTGPPGGNAMQQSERNFTNPVYFTPDEDWRWPLTPATQKYAPINGDHVLEYVKHLTEISHHSRDRGDQLWGRITGTEADAETAQWVMDTLRKVGVTDVHQQALDLPPQQVVKSWKVTVTSGEKSVDLESSVAARGAPGTNGQTIDAEAVYVGLGSEADFAGRDVKGKAVFVYSIPLPGAWQLSQSRFGAAQRAEERGAAAVFNVIMIPGNQKEVVGASTKVPGFTLGSQDGALVREMIEKAPNGEAPHVKFSSDIQTVPDEKTSLVWGVLPGMTGEKIVVNAHRDGYYEAANDNATGVATMLALAEYFAKMPKSQRRRTMIFIGNPGHHNTAVGSQYLVAHKDEFFSQAALLINCEHTAQVRTDLYGNRLMATNDPWGFNLYIGGGSALAPIVQKDLATFGVSHYKELDPSPAGDIGQTYKLAPSLQLIMATHYYHSDRDTYETIPANGLEDVVRAYAKIIDDVNKVDLKDLAWPSSPSRGDVGGSAMLLDNNR